jgi:hypothetical protein
MMHERDIRIPDGYLLISKAVDCLERHMFGGATRPEPIIQNKKTTWTKFISPIWPETRCGC